MWHAVSQYPHTHKPRQTRHICKRNCLPKDHSTKISCWKYLWMIHTGIMNHLDPAHWAQNGPAYLVLGSQNVSKCIRMYQNGMRHLQARQPVSQQGIGSAPIIIHLNGSVEVEHNIDTSGYLSSHDAPWILMNNNAPHEFSATGCWISPLPNRTVVHQNQNSSKASWLLFLNHFPSIASRHAPLFNSKRLLRAATFGSRDAKRRYHSPGSWMLTERGGWAHRTAPQTSPQCRIPPDPSPWSWPGSLVVS